MCSLWGPNWVFIYSVEYTASLPPLPKLRRYATLQTQHSARYSGAPPTVQFPPCRLLYSQRFSLFPAFFYQKDERSLPGNLQSSDLSRLSLPLSKNNNCRGPLCTPSSRLPLHSWSVALPMDPPPRHGHTPLSRSRSGVDHRFYCDVVKRPRRGSTPWPITSVITKCLLWLDNVRVAVLNVRTEGLSLL
jgi:hypothetical protein